MKIRVYSTRKILINNPVEYLSIFIDLQFYIYNSIKFLFNSSLQFWNSCNITTTLYGSCQETFSKRVY